MRAPRDLTVAREGPGGTTRSLMVEPWPVVGRFAVVDAAAAAHGQPVLELQLFTRYGSRDGAV